jgi:hypothetical protein
MLESTTIDQVLTEHNPRGTDDPLYLPWWAKGEYARKNGTKYRLSDGSCIEAGRIVSRGTGSLRKPSEIARVLTPQPSAQKASETPLRAFRTPSKPVQTPRELDAVAQLLADNRTPESRLALCAQYGVDPAILTNAPNPGVASMRLANALRAKLRS